MLDDLPVGGGGGAKPQLDEFASSNANQVDDKNLSLSEKVVHKSWSVRANGFDQLLQIFREADTPSNQAFRDHSDMWKKYLNDINPASLEKALDALEVFISRADSRLVAASQNDIVKILIDKCIGHAKQSIKTKSLECFSLLFEVTEAFDESVETIAEYLGSKNVKISQCALVTLNTWISNYGVKKIKFKTFLPLVETLAGQSNPAVRSEAMNFYKESYKLMGEALKPLISGLKKQQLDDLEKEFQAIKDQPKQKLRLTRGEQEKMKNAALDEIIKQEEETKQIDVYDLVDAVDLLSKYGTQEFEDKIGAASSWAQKKAELEPLLNDSNVPKIKAGDFSILAKIIKKLIGDSNTVVSQLAVKVTGNLAKGLRNDFESQCKDLIPALLAKFREKKPQVIEETNGVLASFLLCTNLETLASELLIGLNDKAPSVKKNVCNFIEKAAQETYIDVLQRISNELLAALVKATDDPQSDVRDAALSAMGILKGRIGETAMTKYLADLNPQKLSKLNESAQNVKPSKYDRPEKREKAPEIVAPPKKVAAKPALGKKPNVKQQEEEKKEDMNPYQQPASLKPSGAVQSSSNNFDDQPIGGKNAAMSFDEQPIGGKPPASFDDQPIGGKSGFNADPYADPYADPNAMGEDAPIKRGAYNLDNLDDMDAFGSGGFGNPPPIKKKIIPAKQKKVVEEEKKSSGGDVLMNDETYIQPEVNKPPPRKPEIGKKPAAAPAKTATVTTTSKGPTGPQIQEEDVGAGMSKEEAEAKVQQTFPSEIIEKFDLPKWNEKAPAFQELSQALIPMQPAQDVIEAVVKFIKLKMKDWKESNINLIKESINLFLDIAKNCEKINKRSVACMMPFVTDKIADAKNMNNVSELLLFLSEIVTPKYISMQVIKYCSQAKAPNIIKEGCNTLIKLTDEFGVVQIAIKEAIDYGILAANNTNPQVRTQAMALFSIMYQHGGETIKNFLKDIKESTMKLIEDEFNKVTPLKPGQFQQKRAFRGEAANIVQQAAPGKKGGAPAAGLAALLDDALPRMDVSKLINPKLIALTKHNDWKERQKGAQQVEQILKDASMRIQPNGLNELMDCIKQRMADPNKAVLKVYIQLIGSLVEALGTSAKQFQKKLLPGMLATLSDKQTLVRGDAVACMDKWAEHVGPEVILNNLGPLLTTDNPELRKEGLQWMIKQQEAIKTSEMKEYIKALMACLSDKTPAIRNLAEEVVSYVMPHTGYAPFQQATADLLPAVQNTMKPIIERIKQKVGASASAQDLASSTAGLQTSQVQPAQQVQQAQKPQTAPAQPTLKPGSAKPQIKPKVQGLAQANDVQNKPPQQNLNQSLTPGSQLNQSIVNKKKENQTPAGKTGAPQLGQKLDQKDGPKLKGLSQTVTSFKQPEEVVQEFLNVNFGNKEKRAEIDRKSKFQVEDIKPEQIEKLKILTSQALGASFSAKMFSNDLKLHLECINAFTNLIVQQPEALMEILDLIFKWATVKLQDNQTQFMVKIFDLLGQIFLYLEQNELQFQEFESVIIIPLLCEKSGLNNAVLKEKVKSLLKIAIPLHDVRRSCQLIVHYGLNSKNLKVQSESLDELSDFVLKYGVDYFSEKDLKMAAKMADNSDKNIRENALKFLGEIYKIIDEAIWRAIGEVTPKVQGLLEQRFKKLKPAAANVSLVQSSSSANFYAPRDQSPKQSAQHQQQQQQMFQQQQQQQMQLQQQPPRELKATSNVGLKKTIQQTNELGKQSATPRSGLQFNKGLVPGQKPPQDLARSLNQFNQSNRSDDQTKRTTFQDPRKMMSTQEANKLPVYPDNDGGVNQQRMVQRAIPQTQRPSDNNLPMNLSQVDRNSEASYGNQQIRQSASSQQHQQMLYDDDDEDLRILTNNNFGELDPQLSKAQDDISNHIKQLKYADLSRRVDSLVSLNEIISDLEKHRPILLKTAGELISAYTHVLNDIFSKTIEEIPLRFAKYFITIVLKTCSCKEIMKEVNEERIFDLAEQLLTRLLIENLDKLGDNKEGELILKNLNSSMLRLLENCNHTYIFCVLFNLLRKYKDYAALPKLPNLIIKCLLKLSKILEKLIEKLDMEKILLAIHEYLVVINHDNKTQNDEMGIRIVKTVTNELVKLKRESIWEAYRVIQCHNQQDNHIYRWIQIILRSLQTQGNNSTMSTSSNIDSEMRTIVEELRNPEKFETAIPKLQRFLDANPQIELKDYLQECSKTFQTFIITNLEKQRLNSKDNKGMDGFGGQQNVQRVSQTESQSDQVELKLVHQSSNPVGSSNRISEYQSKLASIKQRNNQRSGAETTNNRTQGAAGTLIGQGQQNHNLNTSFSAMNTSLSQKWHEINKKSLITKREGNGNMQQMSSTMGSGFHHNAGNGSNQASQFGQMNQSIGAGSSGEVAQGATNQDLNERLAAMKAKFQALKNK